MNFEQLVSAVLKPYNKENDLIFREITRNQIISLYSRFIIQDYNKSNLYKESLIQTIKCVSLKKVSANNCQGSKDGLILETNVLPKPIMIKRDLPFLNVSTNLKNKKRLNISYISVEQLEFIQYRKFTANLVYYTYEDSKIRIINNLDLENIAIRSIFYNPIEAKKFSKEEAVICNCCESIDSPCADENMEPDCFGNDDFIMDSELASLILSTYNSINNDNSASNKSKENP